MNHLVFKTSENGEKFSSQAVRAQRNIFFLFFFYTSANIQKNKLLTVVLESL